MIGIAIGILCLLAVREPKRNRFDGKQASAVKLQGTALK